MPEEFKSYSEEEIRQDDINLTGNMEEISPYDIDVGKVENEGCSTEGVGLKFSELNLSDLDIEEEKTIEDKRDTLRLEIGDSIREKQKELLEQKTGLEEEIDKKVLEELEWELNDEDTIVTRQRHTVDLKDALKLCWEVFDEEREGMKFQVWARSVQRLLDHLAKYRDPYIPSPEQARALITTAPYTLVDACPGSGKTTTLMHKIFFDGQVLGRGKSKQLAITYTNNAARSMEKSYRELSAKFNIQSNVDFGTIHAYAMNVEKHETGGDILSDKGVERIDFSQIDPDMLDFGMDPSEMPTMLITNEDILKETLEELGLTEAYFYHINKLDGWLNIIVEKMITTQDDLMRLEEFATMPFIKIRDLLNILEVSRRKRREKEVINFIDMLLNFYDRLKGAETLNDLSDRTRMIMSIDYLYVDEFQDISPIQWEIVKEILRLNPKCKLYCVGDADQAIYSFRGADPKYLVEYEKETRKLGATENEIDIIYFTINRRSGKEIVNLSASFIENNCYRYNKQMISFKNNETDINMINSEILESPEDFIIKKLKNIKEKRQKEHGAVIDMSDIAIIYREHRQSTALKIRCIEENILISMNKGEFPDTFSETRDILGIWEMLRQPTNAFAVERYLYKCLKSVNKERSKFVANKVRQTGKPFSHFLGENPEVNDLRSIYVDFRNNKSGLALEKTVYKYNTAYLYLFKGRAENLDLAVEYLKTFTGGNWSDFYTKKRDFDSKLSVYRRNNLGVQFFTMHGSKGLEFDKVILLPVGNTVMPKVNIMNRMTPKHRQDYIEEERRLLYVAMTRAKKELTVLLESPNHEFPEELETSYNLTLTGTF